MASVAPERAAKPPSPWASATTGSTTAVPPLPRPDPFTLALGDCVRSVREDDAQPTCRFFRPLDEMDFGQRHCDARCAELTEGYRAAHATPSP